MKFCSQCGQTLVQEVPAGDNRLRAVCHHCDTIHYENPKIIAGTLPIYQGEYILLCKRAIEPRIGFWTLPAGFMENGESLEQAALRETREEALAEVTLRHLYTHTSIVHVSQVQFLFLADLHKPEFGAGEETLETRLFHLSEIPWERLAFQTIRNALRFYLQDLPHGHFPLHAIALETPPGQYVSPNKP